MPRKTPASGPISVSDVNYVYNVALTSTTDFNGSRFRRLAKKPSGTISLSDVYNSAAMAEISLGADGTNIYNVDLKEAYIAATGDRDNIPIYVTFNLLGNIGSKSTSSPALRTGSWPAGSEITLIIPQINADVASPSRGVVAGKGGDGDMACITANQTAVALPGGTAISLDYHLNVINNGIIGGGGGGGGGSNTNPGFFFRIFKGGCVRTVSTRSPGGGGAGIDPGAGRVFDNACGYTCPDNGTSVSDRSDSGSYRYGGASSTNPNKGGNLGEKGGDLTATRCVINFFKGGCNTYYYVGGQSGYAVEKNGWEFSITGNGVIGSIV